MQGIPSDGSGKHLMISLEKCTTHAAETSRSNKAGVWQALRQYTMAQKVVANYGGNVARNATSYVETLIGWQRTSFARTREQHSKHASRATVFLHLARGNVNPVTKHVTRDAARATRECCERMPPLFHRNRAVPSCDACRVIIFESVTQLARLDVAADEYDRRSR